jgi:protocatechuate 3,4-dioxygenase beta subunit
MRAPVLLLIVGAAFATSSVPSGPRVAELPTVIRDPASATPSSLTTAPELPVRTLEPQPADPTRAPMPPGSDAPHAEISLTGRVTDAGTGRPLREAVVSVS